MFGATAIATATFACGAVATSADAAGVRAGTLINNIATAFYRIGDSTTTIESNTVTMKVGEIIDVVAVSRDQADASVLAGSTDMVRTFVVTNTGNGPEGFVLHASGTVNGNGFDPEGATIAIDSNANGVYDPGTDLVVPAGNAAPIVEPDASITVFVLSSIPGGAPDGKRGAVELRATAAAGFGTPGTTFAGRGTDGGDAVVGAGHADTRASGGFLIQQASVTIEKAAIVADQYGGSQAMAGAVITYRLIARVIGSGSVPELRLTDTVPQGTAYIAGTLALDAHPMTDAVDGDAGSISSGNLEIDLGTVAAGTTHTAEFKVRIKPGVSL